MSMEETDPGSSDTLFMRLVECRWWSLFTQVVKCSLCRCCRRKRMLKEEEPDLEVIEAIAEGGYGRVFRCRDVNTGRILAMKQIMIFGVSQGVPSSVIREVSILQELNHINVVSLVKVTIENNKFINLVFEHLDCDLHNYIQDRRYPNDAMTTKSFMYQILSAVAYCHSRKVLHRDLKPKNLLIDHSKKLIKLADFGLARKLGDPDMSHTDNVGTCWYRAPEILCDSGQYSSPVDLWSVGCVFAEMVMGKPLFRAMYCPNELEAIFRVLGTPTEDTWPGITQLMSHLRPYPKFSPMGIEAFVTGLERAGLNLLSMMLCLDPNKRITAEAALKHAYFDDVDLVSLLLLF
ncbi:hypothetical protein VNO77_37897 [Canavalia gladiata]|uniref:Protein kinase domain-containing protein n=1 Tax=Canavalia gladiata TaxID=3824 RepID=A0AAN9KCG7_CANGL